MSVRVSIEDDVRSGRPVVVSCSIKNAVTEMVMNDKRITMRVVANYLYLAFPASQCTRY